MHHTYNRTKKFSFLGSLLGLTACSTASESFDTEATKGVGAKSISEVNRMIDRGEISGVSSDERASKTVTPLVFTAPLPSPSLTPIVLSDNTVIHRQAEQVMRIWIAPFQDQQGNFYEASVVHTVHRPSFWSAQMLAPQATPVFLDAQHRDAV
jgi:hypothetical protein